MTEIFQTDPWTERPCESYQLQISLARAESLVAVQRELTSRNPDAYYLMPGESLHITVLPLVDAAETLATPKSSLWSHYSKRWITAVAEACATLPPFDLRFSELRQSVRAVIATAEPSPVIALRDKLSGQCGLPERPVRIPAITHVTLARYRDPEAVVAVPPRRVAIDIRVDRFRLIKETRYPSLEFELLEEFRLSPR